MNLKLKKQSFILVGKILAVVFFLVVVTIGGFEFTFLNKVYPGVTIVGIDLGGKNREQVTSDLKSKLQRKQNLYFIYGNSKWVVPVSNFDLSYDFQTSVELVLNLGRGNDLLVNTKQKISALKNGVAVEPIFFLDENKLVEAISTISGQINVPEQEPEISVVKIDGTYQINILQGENGLEVDSRQLLQMAKNALKTGTEETLNIPIVKLEPKLTQTQMEQAQKEAENLIGKNITVSFSSENQNWNITDEQMIAWLDPQNEKWRMDQIEGWVTQLADGVDKPAQNASFRFENGRAQEFIPAKEGYQVKQQEMVKAIVDDLEKIKQKITVSNLDLIIEKSEPAIKTSDVNSLGIKDLIGKGESWFSGSINNRIFNLKRSAEAINGVLVAPGEIFSFNKYVGTISAATGYMPAYIIKEGKTVLGDGGGVCQTSSTLFRAVLAAGLPIEERVAHAYRVSYYEENYQPGFDATIFQPSPDFKFRNDTTGYILIQMKFDEQKKYLSFELYGTSDGRKVEISKSRVWDITPPPPDLYVDDPTLSNGTIKQIEHKAWGAKVAFDWKVTRGDEILQERTFYSNYIPWQAVYMRGTKI
jgi:vancomycin resistance protein YoaR